MQSNLTYMVFKLDTCESKHFWGHQKCTFQSWICTFMRCGHFTYDFWIWLKVTSPSSTASDLNDGRISLEIPSFCSEFFFQNIKIRWFYPLAYWFQGLSGFKNLSGLNDLNRHHNITGLNYLKSFFGLKKSKAAFTLINGWFPCHQEPQQPQWPQQPLWPPWPQQSHIIKNLNEHDVNINLATKWPTLVSQCGMNHQKNPLLYGLFATPDVRGCGGQGWYFQPNPRVTSQMSASHECTDAVFMS